MVDRAVGLQRLRCFARRGDALFEGFAVAVQLQEASVLVEDVVCGAYGKRRSRHAFKFFFEDDVACLERPYVLALLARGGGAKVGALGL